MQMSLRKQIIHSRTGHFTKNSARVGNPTAQHLPEDEAELWALTEAGCQWAWRNLPPALEDVWLQDFRAFQKYTEHRKHFPLCQNIPALCLRYVFPVYMLEIRRSLAALIRLNAEEGKWEAAPPTLSWNLLSHLFLQCKYGPRPAFLVRMIMAEGSWYGSHFPSRCSSCLPQTQQRHEISLTSDSEKVDKHVFVWASSLGKAAVHYLIRSKIIPIRPWYEYWNISLIGARCRSLNMPIVFTVSITYFKWHGKIIYVNMTSTGAEWCLAKQERLSDLHGLWFQGIRGAKRFGGRADGCRKSGRDWSMGAPALAKAGPLPPTHRAHKAAGLTSSSTSWDTERGWKTCLRVWNRKREGSGRKGRRRQAGYSFRI